MNKSRRNLYTNAVREYAPPHAQDDLTDAMDRVCAEVGDLKDEFVSSVARRILQRSES
jgi:hypothetical protein